MCPSTKGERYCDRVSVPKDHALFHAIGEYYIRFGSAVEEAWLTNKVSHVCQEIGMSDLDLYVAVLEGDLTPFNGNFPQMEALKNWF